MIEENLHKKQTIESTDEVNQQMKFHFIGSTVKKKGQTLWEYNKTKNTLKAAEIKTEMIFTADKGIVEKHKLTQTTGSTYFWALNLKNAQKKVVKSLGL